MCVLHVRLYNEDPLVTYLWLKKDNNLFTSESSTIQAGAEKKKEKKKTLTQTNILQSELEVIRTPCQVR